MLHIWKILSEHTSGVSDSRRIFRSETTLFFSPLTVSFLAHLLYLLFCLPRKTHYHYGCPLLSLSVAAAPLYIFLAGSGDQTPFGY